MASRHLIGFNEKIVSTGAPAGMASDGFGQDRRLPKHSTRRPRVPVPSRSPNRFTPRTIASAGRLWSSAVDRPSRTSGGVAKAALMERPDAEAPSPPICIELRAIAVAPQPARL